MSKYGKEGRQMGKIKSLKIVLLVLLVVIVFVIVKSNGKNSFKQDAQNAIETVVSNNFSVSISELKTMEKDVLVVDLNESGKSQFDNSLQIPFEKLLDKSNLKKLKETENKILLVSNDISKAEKAWVILNQLGLKNVFVLSDEVTPEIFKYKFQPDTAAWLESVSE